MFEFMKRRAGGWPRIETVGFNEIPQCGIGGCQIFRFGNKSASYHRISKSFVQSPWGGLLVYKDMVERPRWRAWKNRLHDLVLARQWINYAPLQSVCDWVRPAALHEDRRVQLNLLWYGHELVVFRRPD